MSVASLRLSYNMGCLYVSLSGTLRGWPLPDLRLPAYLRVRVLLQWLILFCSALFFVYVMIQRHLKFQLAGEISFADSPGCDLRPTHCFSLCVNYLCLYISLLLRASDWNGVRKHLHHTRPKPKNNRLGQLIWCHSLQHKRRADGEGNKGWHDSCVSTIKQSRQNNWKKWTWDRGTGLGSVQQGIVENINGT